ncbi:Sporulation related domain-containing protein [Mariniphaga anaerophila]|uniref:Sporulation related domain-containing protein n=1 Tax=Mariniphaga anaerophila TaxID=1484053 RepID=A0A1M5E129_9BACT|nr:SPOR domain-containing protein [Mariniphaga anaerophila]SHF72957.1 Sporulation related domain-containing protein [Mariniphaga anaerophila]
MRLPFLIILGLLFSQLLAAQVTFPAAPEINAVDSLPADSVSLQFIDDLNINQDSRLERIVKLHVENNRKRDGIKGYRVEIFFSSALSAKEQSLKTKKEFLSKYPDYNVHVKYTAPNFRVRVGDFRTKNEALKLLKQIQIDYPGAFIVPDIIDFPLLKSENYERPD